MLSAPEGRRPAALPSLRRNRSATIHPVHKALTTCVRWVPHSIPEGAVCGGHPRLIAHSSLRRAVWHPQGNYSHAFLGGSTQLVQLGNGARRVAAEEAGHVQGTAAVDQLREIGVGASTSSRGGLTQLKMLPVRCLHWPNGSVALRGGRSIALGDRISHADRPSQPCPARSGR